MIDPSHPKFLEVLSAVVRIHGMEGQTPEEAYACLLEDAEKVFEPVTDDNPPVHDPEPVL